MASYIISHDMGTSSDKAVLVDFDGKIIASATADYPIYHPAPGWVEQKPDEYWTGVVTAVNKLIEKTGVDKKDIKGMVFSTQSMGVIPVDEDGNPLYNNISWVDSRAQKQADSIMARFGGKSIFSIFSGTPIMGKDVIAKLIWIKEERPEIYRRTKYFLDVNGYLKLKCTGKMVAEYSGASSYGFDLKTKSWLGVLKLTGLDVSKLPPLVKSTDNVGGLTKTAAKELGLLEGTPVFGGCDDVQSACIGSGMTRDGDIHIYLGTSAWVCASSKTQTKFKHGAAAIQSADPNMNIIVGITEAAGSNIQWLQEQFFRHEKEKYGDKIFDYMGELVSNVAPGSDYLICTPWMLGERCPVSSTTTRATLFNINPEHTREHLMRAVYEGIGYNLRWILDNFKKDYKFSCDTFRIIGGGAQNKVWMQMIADITGTKFDVVDDPRSSGALGAAIIALIGLGEIKSFEEASKFVTVKTSYRPNPATYHIYSNLFARYKEIYYSLNKVYKKANGNRFEGELEGD